MQQCKTRQPLISCCWLKAMSAKIFDGMCCMNLSDHSKSIHKSTSNVKQLTKLLLQHDEGDWWGVFSWLNNLGS